MKNNLKTSIPKISIIVPAYKAEKYIKECLDSVINQTFSDIEIIITDEGDFDETRKIIEKYKQKDSRIIYLNKFHGGYGASMNDAIEKARGEYLGIVEADDWADKNMFFDLYNIAHKFNADIVKSDYYTYTNSNSRKAGIISRFLENKIINIKSNPEIIKIQPTIWTSIYKKEFLNKHNIRFLNTKGGSYQDTSFSFKALSCAENIVFTKKAYLYYRCDNELSSVNSKSNVYAICGEYREIDSFLNKNPKIKSLINTQKLIKQFNTYIWNLNRIDKASRKEFIEQFSKEFYFYFKNKEITQDFYKKVNKKDFGLLLFNKEQFENRTEEIIKKREKRKERNKNFSIRINTSRMSVILFGKQILKREF